MKTAVSERIRSLQPSATLAIDAQTKALIKSGVDVCNLSAGEPDFPTPIVPSEAGIEAIRRGLTHYTPNAGLAELRTALSLKLQRDNGLDYGPEQVIVSNGAKQSVFNALLVLLDPGDEVVIPSPCWVSYPEIVRLAGGIPRIVDTTTTGCRLSADLIAPVLTQKTKAIILNSPCNPTGVVYTEHELRMIAALAVAHDLYVISDEIYEKIVYSSRAASIGALSDEILARTITVNGFSKAYAMTGWRLGYAAARPDIAVAMGNVQGQVTSGASSIGQHAAVAALNSNQDSVEEMRVEFDRRRCYVADRLRGIPGVQAGPLPEGAFYFFPRVADLYDRMTGQIRGSVDFAQQLLTAANVAVVPGSPFGSDDHIRVSYAVSMDALRIGMDRLEAFVVGRIC
jgi:aspartate aminotransferase